MFLIPFVILLFGICLAEEQSLDPVYGDPQAASYGDVIYASIDNSVHPSFFYMACQILRGHSPHLANAASGEATWGKVFRHGDRTPDSLIPTDPPELSYWEEGIGQLTKVGKLRAYKLGKWFREHYSSLLVNESYRYDVLTLNSSAIDRTMMSAELFLAGMYPPSDQEMWNNENLRWQPIPVNVIPSLTDHYLRYADELCKRYLVEIDEVNEMPELLNLYAQYRLVIEYVTEHSGMNTSNGNIYQMFWDMNHVYDTLSVEVANNRTIQEWAQKVFPEPLKTLGQFAFRQMTLTDDMKLLRAGPLLGLIVQDIEKKAADSLPRKKFQIYSGHDTTVAVLLDTLGVFNGLKPPYSSGVIFELRKKEEDYFVGVFFRNSSATTPHTLRLEGCERDYCTLEEFLQKTLPLIPADWEESCDYSDWTTFLAKVALVCKYLVVVLGLFIAAVIIIAVIRLYVKGESDGYRSI